MKQMKNGVAIGAVALFALTGCVTDLAYVPETSGEQPCVTGPCEEGPSKIFPKQQDAGKGMNQVAAPSSLRPATIEKTPDQYPGQYPDQYPDQYPNDGLPTNVQPGECYSRCLAPAVFEDVEEQIEVAPAMDRTEIIPAVYDWVQEQVLVKEASEKIRVIPTRYDWVEEQVVVKEASEEVKVIPARYEWREVEEVVKEESEELNAIPAVYAWREGQVMVSPEIITVTIIDPGYEEVKEQVLVKDPSAKWIKKATHCTPEDIKMGLTDCDTLCYVAVPAMYKTVVKKVPSVCAGGGIDGCREEVVIPPEYKPVRTKVVVEPARTETITVPAEYRTVRKQVLVEPARTETITLPPEYRIVRKKVMVEPARTEVTQIPAQYKTVRVKKLVKEAEETVVQLPAEYKTIIKKVKVSDSRIVWRPALCEDEAVDSKIRALQSALSREGFYTGPVNGVLTQEANEAIRAYQVQQGLPQGGGMTLETLEALGIY
ncbi:MAG: hypothetical protein D3916_02190 [Candidatus Electrothrix sp. MAN1_4]|nr:hypothetical protein [Candidatus Electrothrix sp. MAN1_4]